MLNLPNLVTKSSLTKIVFSLFILISLILAGELIYWRYLQGGLQKGEKGATFYQELLDQYGNTALKSESVLLSVSPPDYSETVWIIKGGVEQIDKNVLGVSSEKTIPAWVKVENQTPVYLFDKTYSISEKQVKSVKEIKVGDSVIIHIDEPAGVDFRQYQYRAKAILKII